MTAVLMEDFHLPANPQQVTLNGAQTSACFNLTIIDDSNIELTECVTLMAVVTSANVNYRTIEEQTRLCIMDNDGELWYM